MARGPPGRRRRRSSRRLGRGQAGKTLASRLQALVRRERVVARACRLRARTSRHRAAPPGRRGRGAQGARARKPRGRRGSPGGGDDPAGPIDHRRVRCADLRSTGGLRTPVRRTRPHARDQEDQSRRRVAEDIARLLAANSPATFLSSREGLVLLFASLPWVSRAQPEDLYWPAEYLEAVRVGWRPEQAASLLRDTEVGFPAAEPARAQAVPGRNESCPCGSGKKYKRCHGL